MHIRVLTYNIHKCIGGVDRRYDPERVRDTIAHYEPDLVLLQEVDQMSPRSNHDRQVDLLGDMLGFRNRTYFPNVQVRSGGEYGNAILSRFPLTDTRNIDVTVGRRKRRSVLHARARVRLPGTRRSRTVHVFNMHLGLSGGERKIQLQRFLDSHPFNGFHHETPVIVGGDLNDVWGTLGGRFFVPAGFGKMPRLLRTFPSYAPVRALDGIYVRGSAQLVKLQRSRLELAKRASDHLPLIADIELT
ncbi:endonuclease/exonuclease/phosphatase family protein [Haliangium sp.]|uniref:endonuclease/exonuclease/phosphatase family protein n=1 Tax=Haliangium sp. TaxID=2663208 RepID=UPI003D0F45C7